MTLPTLEELRPRLRESLREIGETLRADVANGRLALSALLGDQRIRVHRDGRFEGALGLIAETPLALDRLAGASGPGRPGGSGGAQPSDCGATGSSLIWLEEPFTA